MYDQDWDGWRPPPTMADLRSGEMPRDARPAPAGHAGEMPLPQGAVNQQAGVQALGDLDGFSCWAAAPPTNSGWELAQRPEAGTSGSHIPAQGDARARLDWQLAQYHVPPEMLGTSVMQMRPGTGGAEATDAQRVAGSAQAISHGSQATGQTLGLGVCGGGLLDLRPDHQSLNAHYPQGGQPTFQQQSGTQRAAGGNEVLGDPPGLTGLAAFPMDDLTVSELGLLIMFFRSYARAAKD